MQDKQPDALRKPTGKLAFAYQTIAALEQTRADLEAENTRLKSVLKGVGLFLHHCWCDVQMNDYSFEKLNKQMEAVDAALEKQS